MDIKQAHFEFKMGYDKVDSLASPNLEPIEIDTLLNNAQDVFIKTRFGGNNVYRQGVEANEKRTQDLATLVRTLVADNPSSDPASPNYEPNPTENPNHPNAHFYYTKFKSKEDGIFIRLPEDFMLALQEEAVVYYKSCGEFKTNVATVKPISHDRYMILKKDPYRTPDKDTVYRLTAGVHDNYRVFELIESYKVTINNYTLRYIKYPKQVSLENNVSFELPEHTHREIIEIAVTEALKDVGSPLWQPNVNDLNRIE